ncbi:hypothetical protein CVT26_010683 [Gymnopilus dilepis]|uniref:FBD domain-containing protein n=1 Tax=Gymnopilus dilepis TaxID=231916 RepID=A0A409Y0R7_9AGAR|nr:hypothetical protein CVT26_010683 [Gymnopilus dilepis]
MTFVADGSSGADTRLVVEAGKLFFGAVKRAKSLAMHGMEGFPWKEIEADIRSGEMLETLSLDLKLPDNDDGAISAISKIWSPSTSLRNFTWGANVETVSQEHVEHFKGLSFPFQALTFLELNAEIEVQAFYYILSLTPSLVTAKFDSVEGELDYEVIEDVKLSDLRELTLDSRAAFSPPSATQLLEFIIAPSLTTLSLMNDGEWFPEAFQTFLQKASPRIEHLRLHMVDSTDDEKIECLKLLPFLRSLDLRVANGTDDWPDIGSVFCCAMQEWNASTHAFSICPELEKLAIDYDELGCTSSTVFADMVEARWRRSLEAGKAFKLELMNTILRQNVGEETPMEKHEVLTEIIRILVLKNSGLDVTVEPNNWLLKLFRVS